MAEMLQNSILDLLEAYSDFTGDEVEDFNKYVDD